MTNFVIVNARLLTLAGDSAPRRSDAMNDLGIIEHGYVLVREGLIVSIDAGDPDGEFISSNEDLPVIDAYGRVLMPAFVDCHTHCCWAGSRLDEFEMGLRGISYLDILAKGGGIMSTVRAVREATKEQLSQELLPRIGMMASLGTTTVEIKSG